MKKILVISHISEAYAPTFPFVSFLESKTSNLEKIYHPLVNTSIRKSVYAKRGNEILKEKKHKRSIKTIDYVYHFFITLKWTLFNGKSYDIIYGMNSICVLNGLILKLFRKAKIVIYYTVDYADNRFNNFFLNKVYYYLDSFCIKMCNYTYSVSPRIVEVRRKKGLTDSKNILQSNGVHKKNIKIKDKSYEKIKIIFAGHITKSKGIDLIIESLNLLEHKDNIILDIFGDGPFISELENKIKEYNLDRTVFLKGNKKNQEILDVLPNYHIGIALYTSDDQFNYYCDPVKVKEYMAAKCGILISNIPYISKVIEEKKIGLTVSDDIEDIKNKLEILTKIEKIKDIQKNYNNLTMEIDWYNIFENNYNQLLKNNA